jgi:hypothetical protein
MLPGSDLVGGPLEESVGPHWATYHNRQLHRYRDPRTETLFFLPRASPRATGHSYCFAQTVNVTVANQQLGLSL